MSTKSYPVVYDRQLERFIGQFMRAVSGLQVIDGVERNGEQKTRRVDVVWGAMDRVVSSIVAKRNDHLVNSRLPIIGVAMTGLSLSQESRTSPYWNEPIPKRSQGETGSIHRMVGPPYILGLEASIYASSTSELFMILEQMLLIFNPRLVIQSDTSAYNSDYITSVSLEGIQPEITFPLGAGSQECMMSLTFSAPVRFRFPIDKDKDTVEKIISNVMYEGDDTPIFSEELLGDIDNRTEEVEDGK